jgi:prepilin-type N-terminal cleavage/methylation domain-containing protein
VSDGPPRGTTLLELLVALALLVVVASAALGLLAAMSRTVQRQRGAAGVAGTVRAAAAIVPSELRGLASADLVAIAPDSITYRATRLLGVVCSATASEVRLRAGADWSFGWRAPVPGRDTLLLFIDRDPTTDGDDGWTAAPIRAVGASSCGGFAATAIATQLDSAALAGLAIGGPARVVEVMQLKLYLSGGSWWLGARSVSAGETVQPVVGPLAAGGLALAALDSAGSATASGLRARSITLALRAVSEPVRRGGAVVTLADSAVTAIRLRSAPWP